MMKSPLAAIVEIDREIKELQDRRAALEEKRKILSSLSPIRQLACAIHSEFCTADHTESCRWEYQVDTGDAWTDPYNCGLWVTKAQAVLSFIDSIYEVDLR